MDHSQNALLIYVSTFRNSAVHTKIFVSPRSRLVELPTVTAASSTCAFPAACVYACTNNWIVSHWFQLGYQLLSIQT